MTKAAIDQINAPGETLITVRPIKHLNNIARQDYRVMKSVTRAMLKFKSFQAAKCVLTGIELTHMIRKGQIMLEGCIGLYRAVFCRSIL